MFTPGRERSDDEDEIGSSRSALLQWHCSVVLLTFVVARPEWHKFLRCVFAFPVLTSNISSRQTSMRQWPAGGCCWESSCRKIFNFCTRSLLYLGTVRHSTSSGSWAGDSACGGATGTPWSFTCVGWLWRVNDRSRKQQTKDQKARLVWINISWKCIFNSCSEHFHVFHFVVDLWREKKTICTIGDSPPASSLKHKLSKNSLSLPSSQSRKC